MEKWEDFMIRQGDLLIVRISGIPEKAIKKQDRVLAEGEVTGHFHKLDAGDVYEYEDALFFRVEDNKAAVLEHPEHKAVTFEPGEYKVVRQREYAPGEWRGRVVRD